MRTSPSIKLEIQFYELDEDNVKKDQGLIFDIKQRQI